MTAYSPDQIAAAIDAEAAAWATHFRVTDTVEIEARRQVMRANVAVSYFEPLLPFMAAPTLPTIEIKAGGRRGYYDLLANGVRIGWVMIIDQSTHFGASRTFGAYVEKTDSWFYGSTKRAVALQVAHSPY